MRALSALFFLSGATGLVYQSIWSRELHLVFGTSQFAIATVLAAFMAGLAAGGAVAARFAPRVRRPLLAYAALEAVIGGFALAFPHLVDLVEPLYVAFARAWSPSPVVFGVFQFLLVGALMLVPTACMGATLPLLVRLPIADGRGEATGRLYGVNTAGAVLGVWLAGFWLLPELGVRATTVTAAVANLLLAVAALLLARRIAPVPAASADEAAPVALPLLGVAALAGAASLALEVAWFRLLTLVLGGSTYAFTVMLLAFLVGIAAGGRLGGPLADRLAARGRLGHGLVAVQVAVAVLCWGAMWAYGRLPLTFVQAYWIIEPMPELLWPMKCLLGMAVMTPPAIGMGATFPLLVRAARGTELGRSVGQIYAANTVGSIAGAFLGGFVLLPALHVTGTVLLCVTVNLLAAVVAAWHVGIGGRRPLVPSLMTAAVAATAALAWAFPPPWNPMLMTSGVYKYVDNLDEPTAAELRAQMVDRYELLFYDEGLSSVVTVARNRRTNNVWLANNGKIEASSTTDMPTQMLVSHLPMLFARPDADDAMVIGLASGITLGALTLHPDLERVDVVEIEPAIREATAWFRRWNHDPLADPRDRLLENDGRNQLLLTPEGTYDVIVAEPSNPWLTGVANLFTREFFAMGKARLAPGGVWSQWVQMYGMDARDLRAILRTFCEVYPHVLVFSTIRDADLVMVGSDAPLVLDEARAEALVGKNVGIEGELAQVGIFDGYDLLAHFLFDRETALEVAGDVPLNTDDNLLVEFSAPKNLHRETSTENFLMLLPHARAPLAAVADADGLLRLARAYGDRDDTVRALVAVKEAEAREPGRDDTLAAYRRFQRLLAEKIGL